jgi:glycosyltransferase involved in cell wall biosynthesis
MLKVAAFTQGVNVPSARFRVRQLVPQFRQHGMELNEFPALRGSYPPPQAWRRPFWLAGSVLSRLRQVAGARDAAVSILQREFISTLPTIESLARGRRVLDVDDAIWLLRGGIAAGHLARVSDHIVCGNQFLADYFGRFGKPVTIIPTAVDTAQFRPLARAAGARKVIGWSGTAGGYVYFAGMEDQLATLLARNPGWTLRIVSDQPPPFTRIAPDQLEFIRWSPQVEASTIQGMDIGLMPLDDTPWSRGKCSYKMLLYMACGVPVVVSQVGMNSELLAMAPAGLGVADDSGWSAALEALMQDERAAAAMGRAGRALVEQRFSLDIVGAQWRQVIDAVTGSRT